MRTERLTNKHYKRFHLYIYTCVNFLNGNTFSSNLSCLTDQLITHKLRTRKWNYLFQLDLFSICTPAIRKTFAKVENTRNFLLEFFYISTSGYPSTRGPVCFDCPQVSDPALCDTIKVCDQNQVLFISLGVTLHLYEKNS